MIVSELIVALDVCAPLSGAQDWDNVGLLLGRSDAEVHRALIAIDMTAGVLAEAKRQNIDLIVAYHPPWFSSKKRLIDDDLLLCAAQANICIYSPHTALDSAVGGTNDVLVAAAGVPLGVGTPLVAAQGAHPTSPGMGRVGSLPSPQDFEAWLAALKRGMSVQHALVAHPQGEQLQVVARVAVCAGAGDDLLAAALASGADTFVVGEMRHHQTLAAVARKMRVVALLHSGSERAALAPYAQKLQKLAPRVTFRVSTIDADPYVFA